MANENHIPVEPYGTTPIRGNKTFVGERTLKDGSKHAVTLDMYVGNKGFIIGHLKDSLGEAKIIGTACKEFMSFSVKYENKNGTSSQKDLPSTHQLKRTGDSYSGYNTHSHCEDISRIIFTEK